MKANLQRAASFLLAAAIGLVAAGQINANASNDAKSQEKLSYSTTGHGPRIVLLHDSTQPDLAWAEAARQLANRFEITLVDVSDLLYDNKAVQRLRATLQGFDIEKVRIAGSAKGEHLALRYALSYPKQAQSFTLPHTREDLEILTNLINSTLFCKS